MQPDFRDSSDFKDVCDIDDLSKLGGMRDSGELSSRLAGQIGQASLDRLGDGAHPELDQHLAAVRDAIAATLGRRRDEPAQVLSALVRYASGFVDAATGRGWWPSAASDQPVDWESMRLAAVCLLVSELSSTVAEIPIKTGRRPGSGQRRA
jgi:DNA-binding transcriptional ArsR family regulator